MRQQSIFVATALLAVCMCDAEPVNPVTYTGEVIGVPSGDTLTVIEGGRLHTVRLFGIKAPITGQPFAAEAQKHLSMLALYDGVKVTVISGVPGGTEAAQVSLLNGQTVSNEMLKAGCAWWWRDEAPDARWLPRLEADAKESRKGLWSEEDPTPPWEFAAQPSNAAGATTEEPAHSTNSRKSTPPPDNRSYSYQRARTRGGLVDVDSGPRAGVDNEDGATAPSVGAGNTANSSSADESIAALPRIVNDGNRRAR